MLCEEVVHTKKARSVLLIALMISGALTTPFSDGVQPVRIFVHYGIPPNEKLSTFYNLERSSATQKSLELFSGSSGSTASANFESIQSSLSGDYSQTPQSLLSLVTAQDLVGANVFVLQDSQTGQYHVLVIASGQNFESERVSPVPLIFAPLVEIWLDSERRRSRFRIYVEILDLLKRGPMTPYEVAFHLRLNRKKAREHLEFLRKNSFLEFSSEDGRSVYSINPTGKTFVDNLKTVLESR